jgi:site-specific DNA-methyltransferase (adenine-specific)
MRKEVIGDCELYLGDCRDVLPTLGRVDAVVTDPPYGIGKDGQKQSSRRKAYDFLGWDSTRPDQSIFEWILNNSTYSIIWGGNYFSDLLPASQKWLVWNKEQRINQSDGELAWTSMGGALRIFDMNRVELMIDGAEHPTQKPIQLMKWCLQQLPDTCQTILDPFMGSGTTGVACARMGRKFIGIELDPTYYEIALRRISEAYRQGDMFLPKIDNPEQIKLI